jgi:beta-barrel assembly-enhancing protease
MSFGGYGYDQRQSPISGDLLRWVGALLIALFGLAMYMFRTETNPVTGEVQHIAIDVDEEKALGLQAAPKMASQMGGAIDPRDDGRAALVSQVGRRIVAKSDAGRSPYVDNFHFYLLNDPKTINAFALPGGQVFITRALYDKLRNEAQLAGILGHEIGHVIARHSAQQMATGQLGQILTTAVGVGASGGRDRGRTATMAAALANQMLTLRYSRGDESQADEIGLKYMAQAGYDPRSMLDVMKILKEASSGDRQPEFLATHPLPETRLEAIQQQIDKSYPDGVPGNLTRGRSLGGSRLTDQGIANPTSLRIVVRAIIGTPMIAEWSSDSIRSNRVIPRASSL